MGIEKLKERMAADEARRDEIYERHKREIAIKQPSQTRERADASRASNKDQAFIEINIDDIDLEGRIAEKRHPDLEYVSRETVIKMLGNPFEENFEFKTELQGGANYVQAMRQVLSRARKKAKQHNYRLDDFKLLEKEISHNPDADPPHDKVVLVCSKILNSLETSVYDEVLDKFKR